MKKKQFYNQRKLIIHEDNFNLTNFDKFPIINDFTVRLGERVNSFGRDLDYYSLSLGYLASFPWWDHVENKLKKMKLKDIPLGTLDKIYNDMDLNWEIIIFLKRNYVYVLQSSNEGSGIFEKWFRVDKEIYFVEWEKVLKQARK